jgi:hypothetical protein
MASSQTLRQSDSHSCEDFREQLGSFFFVKHLGINPQITNRLFVSIKTHSYFEQLFRGCESASLIQFTDRIFNPPHPLVVADLEIQSGIQRFGCDIVSLLSYGNRQSIVSLPNQFICLAVLYNTLMTDDSSRSQSSVIIVHDTESLRKSLRGLKKGTTLRIAAGDYPGGHYVNNLENITIEAQDPKNPPHFKGGVNGMQFSRCNNLTLRNLKVSGQMGNGINLDDGGIFDQPTTGVLLEKIEISDIGPIGNFDGIKCSGLDQLTIRDCLVTGWGGQGIDMVGCHNSVISGCRLVGKPGFSATAGVQTKGGCITITIEKCRFVNAGERPLNIGGSTDLKLFRPSGAMYEAKDIVVRDNVIEGGLCAAAFVGVDGGEFTGNTILYPKKWIFRILQETKKIGYATCGNVLLTDNKIVFLREQVQNEINVGEKTNAESFRFVRNQWFAEDRIEVSRPTLPSIEKDGTYGVDPR